MYLFIAVFGVWVVTCSVCVDLASAMCSLFVDSASAMLRCDTAAVQHLAEEGIPCDLQRRQGRLRCPCPFTGLTCQKTCFEC